MPLIKLDTGEEVGRKDNETLILDRRSIHQGAGNMDLEAQEMGGD